MNEKLALLITQVKAKRKAYDRAVKKFNTQKVQDFYIEYRELRDAESDLARWIVKHADKLRSVE